MARQRATQIVSTISDEFEQFAAGQLMELATGLRLATIEIGVQLTALKEVYNKANNSAPSKEALKSQTLRETGIPVVTRAMFNGASRVSALPKMIVDVRALTEARVSAATTAVGAIDLVLNSGAGSPTLRHDRDKLADAATEVECWTSLYFGPKAESVARTLASRLNVAAYKGTTKIDDAKELLKLLGDVIHGLGDAARTADGVASELGKQARPAGQDDRGLAAVRL